MHAAFFYFRIRVIQEFFCISFLSEFEMNIVWFHSV